MEHTTIDGLRSSIETDPFVKIVRNYRKAVAYHGRERCAYIDEMVKRGMSRRTMNLITQRHIAQRLGRQNTDRAAMKRLASYPGCINKIRAEFLKWSTP